MSKEAENKLDRLLALLDKYPSILNDPKIIDYIMEGILHGVGLYIFNNILEPIETIK